MSDLNRNGVASVADLCTSEWDSIFSRMERYSDLFVNHLVNAQMLGPEYRWPIDPLHNFTRLWEYPYILGNLLKHLPPSEKKAPRVLDIGSALTFFPSFLISEGYDVTGSDRDSAYARAWTELIRRPTPKELSRLSQMEYRTLDCTDLGAEPPESYGAITCVSVLEHLADPALAAREFSRALEPNGILVLTVDLQYPCPIPEPEAFTPAGFQNLLEIFDQLFDRAEPEVTTHPIDVLRYSNHPREISRRAKVRQQSLTERLRPWHTLPRRLAGRIARQAGQPAILDQWSVYGAVYRRKA